MTRPEVEEKVYSEEVCQDAGYGMKWSDLAISGEESNEGDAETHLSLNAQPRHATDFEDDPDLLLPRKRRCSFTCPRTSWCSDGL